MNAFERRQQKLLNEFDRYTIDHPEFAERMQTAPARSRIEELEVDTATSA